MKMTLYGFMLTVAFTDGYIAAIKGLDGLFAVAPCGYAVFATFKTVNEAKIGRNTLIGKGYKCGDNIMKASFDGNTLTILEEAT